LECGDSSPLSFLLSLFFPQLFWAKRGCPVAGKTEEKKAAIHRRTPKRAKPN
jgi:hypothetical protein